MWTRERCRCWRRARLAKLVERFDNGSLLLSETFSDGERLLAECEKRGIERIVSKRSDAPYRSGKCEWIKVKTRAWREANRYRDEMFNQR